MTQERYFIGPGLRDKLRETITRVDGMMDRERGVKNQVILQELPRRPGGSDAFRICTFTGSWSIATDKTVTFKYQTSTPNTVVATNLFWPVPDGGQRDCAIARDGAAWFLVTPQMSNTAVVTTASLTTTGIQFSTYKVLSMAGDETATFTITPPTVDAVTGASLSETGLEFTRSQIGVIFVNTAVTLSVSVTTCSTAAV